MPFFLSDKGRYIWSDDPFRIDIEDGVIRIEGGSCSLEQAGSTLREAYLAASEKHFPFEDKEPLPEVFFKGAQYNTWMEFTYYPTQEGVLSFAGKWPEDGYRPGIFIIDEGWQEHTCYGTWDFDRSRFPDPEEMVRQLHEMGYTVMLWVVPFITPAGPAYVRSLQPLVGTDPESAKHLYLRNETGEPALVRWWNGVGAILDMRDPYNEEFLERQLSKLMNKYGVDGFKFDGGNVDVYSQEALINGQYAAGHSPHGLNAAWCSFGSRFRFHEYKDTYGGGGLKTIQRLHDKLHSWDNHGLNDLIPCGILCGLIGHPFFCPDMVGGGEWSTRFLPGFRVDEELFVRMAQCSALFPMMQFSWAPWNALSERYQELVHQAAMIHRDYSDVIMRLVRESEKTGEPVVRNLEYNDPHQGFAGITDEFMLGRDILVAPVVTKGTARRTVTFPEGVWLDEYGNEYPGREVFEIDAPIERLPRFTRKI